MMKNPQPNVSKATCLENQILTVSNNIELFNQFYIPEPTRSLLWITNEDVSKISIPGQIKIEFKMGKNGVEVNTVDESYNFYSEPSLIWTRLPTQPNNEIETEKMYFPIYSQFSPVHRFQYLRWLTDVKKYTNLSYVFLYYYGLERHLLIGNYDLAVDEILRLIKYHDEGSFKEYATNALIIGSGYRKRPDIIEKAPFILEELSPISLFLQRMACKPLSAENVINLANRVGFFKKSLLNRHPILFKKELQQTLDSYPAVYDPLQNIDITSLPKNGWACMANESIPSDIRGINFVSVLQSYTFKSALKKLLNETHLKIKKSLKK